MNNAYQGVAPPQSRRQEDRSNSCSFVPPSVNPQHAALFVVCNSATVSFMLQDVC